MATLSLGLSAFYVEMPENSARQKIVASHAVKQTYRAQVSRQSASQTRKEQDHAERRERLVATY
jgi:hypothetical protein